MEAIAILHIDPEATRVPLAEAQIERRADFVKVPLGVPLASEPSALAAALRRVAGAVLEQHSEVRGVPVVPSTMSLQSQTWDEALEEIGELADWIVVADFPAGDGLAGLMSAFAGMAGPGALEKGLPDMSQLAAALEGEQGQALLGQALGMAQQLAAEGRLPGLLQALGSASGPGGMPAVDPQSLASALQEQARPEAADLSAQAQEMMRGMNLEELATKAHAVLNSQPDLEKALRERLGAATGRNSDADQGTDKS